MYAPYWLCVIMHDPWALSGLAFPLILSILCGFLFHSDPYSDIIWSGIHLGDAVPSLGLHMSKSLFTLWAWHCFPSLIKSNDQFCEVICRLVIPTAPLTFKCQGSLACYPFSLGPSMGHLLTIPSAIIHLEATSGPLLDLKALLPSRVWSYPFMVSVSLLLHSKSSLCGLSASLNFHSHIQCWDPVFIL